MPGYQKQNLIPYIVLPCSHSPGHQLGLFAVDSLYTDDFRQRLHMLNTSYAVQLISVVFRKKLFFLPPQLTLKWKALSTPPSTVNGLRCYSLGRRKQSLIHVWNTMSYKLKKKKISRTLKSNTTKKHRKIFCLVTRVRHFSEEIRTYRAKSDLFQLTNGKRYGPIGYLKAGKVLHCQDLGDISVITECKRWGLVWFCFP